MDFGNIFDLNVWNLDPWQCISNRSSESAHRRLERLLAMGSDVWDGMMRD